jgi:hypothetical protein
MESFKQGIRRKYATEEPSAIKNLNHCFSAVCA